MEEIIINNTKYNLKEIDYVGSGMPNIFSICLNYKNGKKVFITLEKKNAKGFAIELNEMIKKVNNS